MAEFFDTRSETIAFFLGFLSATLFWWILTRLRPLLPRLRAKLAAFWQSMRRKSHDRADAAMRQDVLRRAQALHLAAPLFPLDTVLIEPALLAAPPALLNLTTEAPETYLNQAIPYLPDWPILTAQYSLPTLSLSRALENNARIVVIGQPGSGKSVALAHFAAQLARNDTAARPLTGALPVLLHALDLVLEPAPTDPLEVIIRAAQSFIPRLVQARIPRALRFMANSGQCVLCLDGIDELPAQSLRSITGFLASLGEKYPMLKIIATGAPEHLDGLLKAGFQPLALRAWSSRDTKEFIQLWSKAWASQIAPRLAKDSSSPPPVDERIISNWLLTEPGFLSPMEWTLRIWELHAGDVSGADVKSAIQTHLRRLTHGQIPLEGMAALAGEYILQNRVSLSYNHLDGVLSKLKISEPAAQGEVSSGLKSAVKTRKISGRSRIISVLLESGIMAEHPGEQIRFAHPVFTGMLASQSSDPGLAAALPAEPYWCAADETCRFLAAQNQAAEIFRRLLPVDEDPIYSGLLRASRWLKDAPAAAEWRGGVLRRLVTLAQRESVSASLRARFLTAILAANDSSTPLLLKQMLTNESPVMRQLAALALGAISSDKFVDDLIALTTDTQPEVRCAALAAISASCSPRAMEIVNNNLNSGEEDMQLFAAEILAHQSPAGHEALQTALATDQLLARRAAVAGLAQIREPWAAELLEKVSVEDAQWVVRSAAGQALEERRSASDPIVPAPLPRPVDAPWLITFASKQGMGIPTDKTPTDLLLQALKIGSKQEKLGALTYLRAQPDDAVLAAIYELIRDESDFLSEAAVYSLWHIASSGVPLPAPASLGSY